jgi:hypothetical protein
MFPGFRQELPYEKPGYSSDHYERDAQQVSPPLMSAKFREVKEFSGHVLTEKCLNGYSDVGWKLLTIFSGSLVSGYGIAVRRNRIRYIITAHMGKKIVK